jgi:predicted pyridoxine 5'-phosphate oxidase superfamily flavin-nucleotide-binding protein
MLSSISRCPCGALDHLDRSRRPYSSVHATSVLQAAELFWISTVRPDGQPQVTPLVAVWHEKYGEAWSFGVGDGA